VGIGVAYHRLHKPEQAFEAYREASRINPNDPYTLRNLGGLLIAMKRPA
jgi:Flp pilus assembly protein TadD